MKRISLILVTILFVSITFVKIQAQTFKASAPEVIYVGDVFQIKFTFDRKGKNPKFPNFKDFEVLSGPNLSQSSSISIINGRITREEKYTYSFDLQANKKGKFTIPPATIIYKGKTIKSNPLTIEVLENKEYNKQKELASKNKDLFVKVKVNKTNVYQGEQIIATIKIYTRVDLVGFENIKFPNFKGFWADEIPTDDQITFHRENVNGKIYNVGVLKKTILTPQNSGKLTIEPTEITCVIRKRVSHSTNDFFSSFFYGTYQKVKQKIKSTPITITVKNLPKTDNKNFYGAVGSFNLEVNIDKTQVKTNEAITLRVKISGIGNLRLFDIPRINLPPDFEIYDPKETQKIKNTEIGTKGSRIFEYVFIPRHPGTFEIPPIKFTYFDTKTKKYNTLSSEKIIIKVEKGNENQQTTLTTAFRKEDIKYIGKDIRFIKQKVKKFYTNRTIYITSPKFFLWYLIILLIAILIIIIRRKQIKENANIAKVKNRKAMKFAKKRLKNAEKAMKQNNEKIFYEEIAKAMWQLLSDKLNIPLAELSKENAKSKLINKNVDNDLIEKYFKLIEDADFQRFAPKTQKINMKDFYKNASELITKLNQKIS